MRQSIIFTAFFLATLWTSWLAAAVQKTNLGGYLLVPHSPAPQSYDGGFSIYSAAWPLLLKYPGHQYQSGLVGTWMDSQFAGKRPKHMYTDVEGGLGVWRSTRFPAVTPKFHLGGVAVNFSGIVDAPYAGAGNWEKPRGLFGVAQLSPWLLFPPDGLALKKGTNGQLFGYGYLPLPLTDPQTTTRGKKVPTGNHCWTLFLNTTNFKGPVCFFMPQFWTRPALKNPRFAGQQLDSHWSEPNKAYQMETQYIPAYVSRSKAGTYARVAQMSFPVGPHGYSTVLNRTTVYNRKAMWDRVNAWFHGGPPASGKIDPADAFVQHFKSRGWATWKIYNHHDAGQKPHRLAWQSFVTPVAPNPDTYAYKWNLKVVRKVNSPDGPRILLPTYYHLVQEGKQQIWKPIAAKDVPASTGLSKVNFNRPHTHKRPAYIMPDAPDSSFKHPGPAAGPFYAHLGDGSVVTYYWYKFENQPALIHADLTQTERDKIQARVEKIQRRWTKDRQYLPPPTTGTLVELDPAEIVTPPKGLEIGYVPVATRQQLAGQQAGK